MAHSQFVQSTIHKYTHTHTQSPYSQRTHIGLHHTGSRNKYSTRHLERDSFRDRLCCCIRVEHNATHQYSGSNRIQIEETATAKRKEVRVRERN